jgi:hypothetical protein
MPPIEPSADTRVFAKQLRQLYLALLDEGFSEAQTMSMLGQMMTAAAQQKRTEGQ